MRPMNALPIHLRSMGKLFARLVTGVKLIASTNEVMP